MRRGHWWRWKSSADIASRGQREISNQWLGFLGLIFRSGYLGDYPTLGSSVNTSAGITPVVVLEITVAAHQPGSLQ